ncbi:hypothetical protein TI05_11365 [Achromatium sp. WMS3]|nr:hypothetical protein TI05_11365 [Achromatium sp. WMS3]
MSTINNLPLLETVTASDQLLVYATNQGDSRRLAISDFLEYLYENPGSGAFEGESTTSIYTPITPFTINLTTTANDLWIILNLSAALASGTIILPLAPSIEQEIRVSTTKQVTSFTLNPNGATGYNFPTALAAEHSFTIKYNVTLNSWFRIA